MYKRLQIMLVLFTMASSGVCGQPHALAEVGWGIETRAHYYPVVWVCTGDTLSTDTTDNNGVLCLIDGFWITCTEMTREFSDWYLHARYRDTSDWDIPVTGLSQEDLDSLCRSVSLTTRGSWRIPTREEWTFAYHGGLFSEGYRYSGSDKAGLVAWTSHNSGGRVHAVGLRIPNELGIYDMSGNVAEMATVGEGSGEVCYLGGSCLDAPGEIMQKDYVPPEVRGLRLVMRQPLWFNARVERVFR